MSGVPAALIFDTKVVNNESEFDWSCLVYSEAGYQLTLVILMLVQPLLEQLIRQ